MKKRGAFVAEVLENVPLCAEHFRIVLLVPDFPPSRPGQFIQLQCRGLAEQVGARQVNWSPQRLPKLTQSELAEAEPLLRRPFSLAGRRDGGRGVELDVIYRTIGTGTHWLAGAKKGERLSILGPLGNGFAVREGKPQAALIGGGVGIPPMIYLAEQLRLAGKEVVAFNGARSAKLLPLKLLPTQEVSTAAKPTPCVAEFAAFGAASVIATDDGSAGFSGLVSEAFENWLGARAPQPGRLVVYCCGPEELMRAVAETCIREGIECQLALERHMACGMGTCQSCIVKIRDDTGEKGWSYKLCCTDGPVFDARDVLW